jgi:D-3-phosphoglycerate dehydrogenase / 2-oxoglutarate reductase
VEETQSALHKRFMSTKPPHILVADWYSPEFSIEESVFQKLGWEWSLPGWKAPTPPADEQERQLLERIAKTENITGMLFILAPITAKVIEALPASCKHLQRIGIGLDNVAMDVAKARGITVNNTPDYATEEVAVQAMAMILSLHRQLGITQKALASGTWRIQPPSPITRLSELTVGLVGLGRIGARFAAMIRPLVRSVSYFDPFVITPPEGLSPASLDEVIRESDIVSLHCPLTAETKNLINFDLLATMKSNAILINVSRGALVDAVALHAALSTGIIAGAGLDVYEPEVLPPTSPLHSLDNIILTSHTAWYSEESKRDCRTQAVERLLQALGV